MHNTREKLIELLRNTRHEYRRYIAMKDYEKRIAKTDEEFLAVDDSIVGEIPFCADHLIANGVTIQKEAKLYWKPVEKGVWNLTCSACDSHLGCRENAKHCPECGAKFVKYQELSPEPPKGE